MLGFGTIKATSRCDRAMTTVSKQDFLDWAFGDSLDNVLRGVIAEYLVHTAVGGINAQRSNWDAFDVQLADGTTIEVKAAGLAQSWSSKKPTPPSYAISPKSQPWSAEEGRWIERTGRLADLWVFAFHAETDASRADPFSTAQWEFQVASSKWLDERFGNQKSVRRSVLLDSGLRPVSYDELLSAVQECVRSLSRQDDAGQ